MGETTALFGPADWETGAMAGATVVAAGDGTELAAAAEAALAGGADGARRLGVAGLAAVWAAARDVYETLDGGELVTNRGTPTSPTWPWGPRAWPASSAPNAGSDG